MWAGRFSGKPDKLMQEFSQSVSFDQRLWKEDIQGSLAYAAELQRIGGAPYLHTLSANVPIAANAGYYAEIVREKAVLRRLVDAGTKIVQLSYAGEGQVDDVVDQAEAEVYKVATARPGVIQPRTHAR